MSPPARRTGYVNTDALGHVRRTVSGYMTKLSSNERDRYRDETVVWAGNVEPIRENRLSRGAMAVIRIDASNARPTVARRVPLSIADVFWIRGDGQCG